MGKSGVVVVLTILALFALLTFTVDPFGLMGPKGDADGTVTDDTIEGTGDEAAPALKVSVGPNGRRMYDGDEVGEVDVGLGTATLMGTVVDLDEQPVRLARVELVLPEAAGKAVRTNDDGTYTLRGVPAGQHELRARARGFRTHTEVGPVVRDGETQTVTRIVLRRVRPNTDAIVVRTRDMFGAPIRGAKVLATTIPWDLHIGMGPETAGMVAKSKQGLSNENGLVRLGPLEPGLYNVVASAKGYETTPRTRIMVTSGGERAVTIRLPSAVSVSGQVVDETGQPVKNAYVGGMAQPSWRSALPTETDGEGKFVLDGLKKGPYMFFAYSDAGGTTMSPGTAPQTGLKLVLKGAGVVKGKVTDAAGNPVVAKVRPYQAGPFRYNYSQLYDTKEDGTFEIGLPKGKWNFRAQLPDGRMSDDVPTDVEIGGEATITLKISQELTVQGVVLDQNGDHVAGAHVFVKRGGFPPTASRELKAHTDAEGEFTIAGFVPGSVTLHVTHPLYADTTFEATPSPSEKAKEVKVRLDAGARVFGVVKDAEGVPIANEQVNIISGSDFMDSRSTFTDASGRYVLDTLSPGEYSMTTGVYEQGAGGMRRGDISLSAGEQREINWTKPAAGGTVTGTVLLGEKPVANAAVTAQDTRGPEGAQTGVTNEEGQFEIAGVEIGRVNVTVKTAAGLTGRAGTSVSADSKTGSVTIRIENAGLRARLVDVEGRPLSGVWSNIESGDAGGGWSGYRQLPVTGGDGIIQSTSLPAGRYRLRASEADHAQFVSDPFTLQSGQTIDLGDLTLKDAAQITGRVADDTGAPVEGATVSLFTPDNKPVFLFSMSTTGSDGRFIIRGVESGRYRMRFEKKGLAPGDAWVDVADGGGSADGVLARGGSVNFLVVTDTDEPVSGAKLTIYDDQNRVVTRTLSIANWSDTGQRYTNNEGRTSIADLSAGGYRIVIERQGYSQTGAGEQIRVGPGTTTEARIVVSKDG